MEAVKTKYDKTLAFLEAVGRAGARAEIAKNELARVREAMDLEALEYKDKIQQGSVNKDAIVNGLGVVETAEAKYKETVDSYADLYASFTKAIYQIEPNSAAVIKARYIDRKSWKEICYAFDKCRTWSRRIMEKGITEMYEFIPDSYK